MDANTIAQYTAGADALTQTFSGLSPEQLKATPVPNAWSLAQIFWHLVDSDLVYTDRIKRVIAEEQPTLIGYDENCFAKSLEYDHRDLKLGAELFRLNRLDTAAILNRLAAAAFARTGKHNERGVMTLGDLVAGAVKHLEHHLRFAVEKRTLVGGK